VADSVWLAPCGPVFRNCLPLSVKLI
jgi:hypothetical protein